MDSAGRLVIPSAVRREAGIEPGVPLEVRWRDGVIEIEPTPLPVTIARKGRLLIAAPAAPVPNLRSVTVESTRSSLRDRTPVRSRPRRRNAGR